MDATQLVKQALEDRGMKYFEQDGKFGLGFKGDNRTDMIVIVQPRDKYVSVFTSVPDFASSDEEAVLHNYLRLIMDADICKLTREPDGSYWVVAEVPLSLVSGPALELAIRWVGRLADLTTEQLLSLEKMKEHLTFMRLQQLLIPGPSPEQLDSSVPDFLRRAGVAPERIAEHKLRFVVSNVGSLALKMIALCRQGVLTLIGYTDIKGEGSRLEFYRRMVQANHAMDVGKIALSQDDEVTFLYEMPGADALSVQDAIERLRVYMPLYILTLSTGEDPTALLSTIAASGATPMQASSNRKPSTAASSGGCIIPIAALLTVAGLIINLLS